MEAKLGGREDQESIRVFFFFEGLGRMRRKSEVVIFSGDGTIIFLVEVVEEQIRCFITLDANVAWNSVVFDSCMG
jgi:hypothetical protein